MRLLFTGAAGFAGFCLMRSLFQIDHKNNPFLGKMSNHKKKELR
jgi:nucleoside-diphosphate-sugar epimerase